MGGVSVPQIINDVLENYGENLDAAIESLTQLRLATARTDTEGPEQTLREDTSEGRLSGVVAT